MKKFINGFIARAIDDDGSGGIDGDLVQDDPSATIDLDSILNDLAGEDAPEPAQPDPIAKLEASFDDRFAKLQASMEAALKPKEPEPAPVVVATPQNANDPSLIYRQTNQLIGEIKRDVIERWPDMTAAQMDAFEKELNHFTSVESLADAKQKGSHRIIADALMGSQIQSGAFIPKALRDKMAATPTLSGSSGGQPSTRLMINQRDQKAIDKVNRELTARGMKLEKQDFAISQRYAETHGDSLGG